MSIKQYNVHDNKRPFFDLCSLNISFLNLALIYYFVAVCGVKGLFTYYVSSRGGRGLEMLRGKGVWALLTSTTKVL